MVPRYRVTLTKEEREELETMTRRGKIADRRFINARALLLCDAGEYGPGWNVSDAAAALGVRTRSIEHLKKRFVEDGFEAALARKVREKPPNTPKHGSWLNMAEIELSVLKGQCLDRRIPDMGSMAGHVADWENDRNNRMRKISWQFTTSDARLKLKRLYPSL